MTLSKCINNNKGRKQEMILNLRPNIKLIIFCCLWCKIIKYKINQSFDCPGFEGLYNFCQLAAGGSLDAADLIITGVADVVINWGGGYHHARKT